MTNVFFVHCQRCVGRSCIVKPCFNNHRNCFVTLCNQCRQQFHPGCLGWCSHPNFDPRVTPFQYYTGRREKSDQVVPDLDPINIRLHNQEVPALRIVNSPISDMTCDKCHYNHVYYCMPCCGTCVCGECMAIYVIQQLTDQMSQCRLCLCEYINTDLQELTGYQAQK